MSPTSLRSERLILANPTDPRIPRNVTSWDRIPRNAQNSRASRARHILQPRAVGDAGPYSPDPELWRDRRIAPTVSLSVRRRRPIPQLELRHDQFTRSEEGDSPRQRT